MNEYVVVMEDSGSGYYYRGGQNYTIGNSAKEALECWKKNKPDEVIEYTYIGIISREEADRNGYINRRPDFERWIAAFFLNWLEIPGNFIPLDNTTVQLEMEETGGRLHLSGTVV